MWSHLVTTVLFVDSFVGPFLHIKDILKEIIEIEYTAFSPEIYYRKLKFSFFFKPPFQLKLLHCKSMTTWKFSLICKRHLLGAGLVLPATTQQVTGPTCTNMLRLNMFKLRATPVHTVQNFVPILSP